jgi:hypothetical protein
LLYNFCTKLIGLPQIKAVFDPEYERNQTLSGYDRIYQYYFILGDYDTSDEDDDREDDSLDDE